MPRSDTATVVEVKYLSMNNTHIQVEHVGLLDISDECWIALSAIRNEFNIFDDILDLMVDNEELARVGLLDV